MTTDRYVDLSAADRAIVDKIADKACKDHGHLIVSHSNEGCEAAWKACVEKVDADVNEELARRAINCEFHVAWHRDSYYHLGNFLAIADSNEPYDDEPTPT